MRFMDSKTIGRYRLIKHIASGGMADVFRAVMTGPHGFEKLVAIKMIHGQLTDDVTFVRMFTDEARLSARLVHQNIVQIIDFGETDKRPYLVMEYVNGVDLSAFIKALIDAGIGPLVSESAYIVSEVLKALDYTCKLKDPEGKGYAIVHRDITPQNILLSYDGDVKLTDFGIAKVRGSITTTTAGTLKGKIRYMSPEQARGEAVDHRSDLYSVALVLYELITHRRAYAGDTDMSLLKQVQSSIITYRPTQLNPAIPEGLDSIVMKMLSQVPDDRFYDPASLKEALKPYAGTTDSARAALSEYLNRLFARPPGETNSSTRIIHEDRPNRRRSGKSLLYTAVFSSLAIIVIYTLVSAWFRSVTIKVPAAPSRLSPRISAASAVHPPTTAMSPLPLQGQKVTQSAPDAVLVINATPWALVFIDHGVSKRPLGTTPIKALRVSPGTYTLLFQNRAYGEKRVRIDARPGAKRTVILKYDQVKKRFITKIL